MYITTQLKGKALEKLKNVKNTAKTRNPPPNRYAPTLSRESDSRELFWFLGHSSEPLGAFWRKLVGIVPFNLPDLSKTSRATKIVQESKIYNQKFVNIFGFLVITLRHGDL